MERLKLALRNQPLKLALKTILVGLGITLMRLKPSSFTAIFFITIYSFLYFRPSINTSRFFASYFLNLGLIFAFPWISSDPRLQIIAVIGFALASGLILGVKNLIFIRRDTAYHWAYFMILAFLDFLFFAGVFGPSGQVVAAVAIFLAAMEFYSEVAKSGLTVHSGLTALLYSEFIWALSILPIGFVSKSLLAMLFMLLSADIMIHYLNKNLTREVILRNSIVFGIAFVIILRLGSSQLI